MPEPLAATLRPKQLEDLLVEDQQQIIALYEQFSSPNQIPPSLVIIGAPGVGKTSLARLLAMAGSYEFRTLSAVSSGVKELRQLVDLHQADSPLLLFIDEIHRYNKAQQDLLLPLIETGRIVLIGATTENPSFSLNRALLSRLSIVTLPPLSYSNLQKLAERALSVVRLDYTASALAILIKSVNGDARKLVNLIEIAAQLLKGDTLDDSAIAKLLSSYSTTTSYDSDAHYELASAFIKSLRGSDPEAALYWGLRILVGGEDPRFLFRRLMIFASEDIGNADPRALSLVVSGADAYERIGLPEGEIVLGQCITYCATAPKSNRSYQALRTAQKWLKEHPAELIPRQLVNPSSDYQTQQGAGIGYRYPHDLPEGYDPEANYRPSRLSPNERWYNPTERGYEARIKERLVYWRGLRKQF
jgi:putative ATPase